MALFSSIRFDSDGTYYVSGQLPADCTASVKDQTASSLAAIDRILSEQGLEKDSILRMSVYVVDIAKIAEVNEAYAEFFEGVEMLPARSAFGVTGLVNGAAVEIDCIGKRSA